MIYFFKFNNNNLKFFNLTPKSDDVEYVSIFLMNSVQYCLLKGFDTDIINKNSQEYLFATCCLLSRINQLKLIMNILH